MREGCKTSHASEALESWGLEARERDLSRRVLSVVGRSSGRRRTPDECRHLDALVHEIHGVRQARREAARHS